MHGNWQGGTVLITGIGGTAGRELLRQTAARAPAEIIGTPDVIGTAMSNNAPLRYGDRIDTKKIMPGIPRSTV